jgi:GT2 family glycosyltransferase
MFAVQIQSYNRYEMLCNLIDQIKEQSPNTPIVVVNDASDDKRYDTLQNLYDGVYVRKTPRNGGKKLYWKTVSVGLRLVCDLEWDWLVMLADDVRLKDGFFEDLEKRTKEHKYIYNFAPTTDSCWGSDQYVDGGFMAHRAFWNRMRFKIPPINPHR